MARIRRTNGRSRAIVEVYSECKYNASEEVFNNAIEINYTGLRYFEIIDGEDAKEIEAHTDDIDDLHEYLVLHFEDGTESTFRNSYVDLFVI